jgi:rubrerythrin
MADQALDLQEVLSKAIYREESAHRLYSELSDKIVNPHGAEIFARLSDDESAHREKLQAWWTSKFGEPFAFDETRVVTIHARVDKQTAAAEALELALSAEKEAASTYETLLKSVQDPDLVQLCKLLAEEEWGHFETISAEYQAITNGFYWLDMDFAGHVED